MSVSRIKYNFISVVSLFFSLSASQVQAVPCGEEHEIRKGDTLSDLSGMGMHYSTEEFWPVLYEFNKDRIGNDPNLIHPGVKLRIPCLDEQGVPLPGQFENRAENDEQGDADQAAANQAADTSKTEHSNHSEMEMSSTEATKEPASEGIDEMRLLTADAFGLFVDKNVFNEGAAYQVIEAAIRANSSVGDYSINKINDWSAHLDPLLSMHTFDIGFPWIKPDCSANNTNSNIICDDYLFSDVIMEIDNLIFIKKDSEDAVADADSIVGKKLCRPSGYLTNDLDAEGRKWLSNKDVTLLQPFNTTDCFDMLLAGEVDAVVLNKYKGLSTINSLDIEDKVSMLDSGILESVKLHALVHRDHPNAETLIGGINDSLRQFKETAEYRKIVGKSADE